MCNHHNNYIPAGYPVTINGKPDILIKSIYDIFCLDCKGFYNLHTGKNLDDKGLIHMREIKNA